MANSGIVGALRVLLGLDTAEFDAGIKKTKGTVSGLDNDFKAFGKSFAGAFLPVASVAGAGLALASFAKMAFDTAGKVSDLADQTGLTTDSIQEMAAAAKLTGTSLDAFTNAAFKLGVNLSAGTDKVRNAVEALGLSYKELADQSPDEQFKSIASALGEVEDVQLRNKLAVDLFGKAAKEILPAIAQGYGDIADAAGKAGEEQIKALDETADAWGSFWNSAKALAISTLGQLVINFRETGKVIRSLLPDLEEIAAGVEAIGLKATQLPKVIGAARVAAGLLPKPIKDITMSLEEQRRVEKELEQGAKDSIQAQIALAEARKKAALEQAKAMRDFYNFVGLRRMEDEGRELQQIEDQKAAWRAYYNWIGERRMEDEAALMSLHAVLVSTFDPEAVFDRFKRAAHEVTPAAHKAGMAASFSFAEGFENVINGVGSTLARAFEGGGGIMGAVKSLAAQIGQVLSEGIAASMKAAMGGSVGAGMAAGIAGGIYGIYFAWVAKSFSDMVHLNDAQNEATKSARKLEFELLRQYGTLEDLEKAARLVGVSFKAVWGRQGLIGLQLLTSAAERFRKKLEDLNQEKLTLEDQIRDTRGELNGLLQDAARLGYIFDKEGNFVRVDFKKMQEVAEEFGVSLEALGPAFHAQRLAADAKKIWEAIDLLARGGVDAGTILTGLKDEITKLVQESIKFGTKIPENMRPWIQNLIDTGQLLDENGQKITDISQINFGPPIASEFDIIKQAIIEMVGKLNDLIIRLDKLIELLDNLPHPDAPWADWPPPPTPDEGGWTPPGQPPAPPQPPPSEIPPLAAGGLIRRATRALIGEGGQPELVGPVDFMGEALARAMSNLGGFILPDVGAAMAPAMAATGSGGGTTIINNHFSFEVSTLDTDEISRLIRRRVMPEINSQLANVGELRTNMRDGLGI